MTDFSYLFEKANWQPVIYKGNKLIRIDKFPLKNGDTLLISIEKTNSDCLQGLAINIIGHFEMDGILFKKKKKIRLVFWENTAPKVIKIKIFTKEPFVWIENIWEEKRSYLMATETGEEITKESILVNSRCWGSAMIVEEMEQGRRYRCNDWHPDDNFDDIVFTVQTLRE